MLEGLHYELGHACVIELAEPARANLGILTGLSGSEHSGAINFRGRDRLGSLERFTAREAEDEGAGSNAEVEHVGRSY